MARRIKARAVRKLGELLKDFDGRGRKNKNVVAHTFTTRQKAAEAAGISRAQQTTAARVAAIADPDFEACVEDPSPPGTSLLAELGRKSRLRRSERAKVCPPTEAELEDMTRRHGSANCVDGLLKIAREATRCDPEDVVEAIKRNQDCLSDVRLALGFAARVKQALDKAAPQGDLTGRRGDPSFAPPHNTIRSGKIACRQAHFAPPTKGGSAAFVGFAGPRQRNYM